MEIVQLSVLLKDRMAPLSDTASLDAQVLLAHVLERSRSWVLAHPEVSLSASQMESLESALVRLESGQPLPYVLGRWEFYGLDFEVTQNTLIPRPETEMIVELGLSWLGEHPARRRALDVGTGTGCIAVALAANQPDLTVMACDCSFQALQIAWRNAGRNGVGDRLHFLVCDLLPPIRRCYDLICANLPYVPSAMLDRLPVGRREPRLALDGGADGLDLIRRLLSDVRLYLAPGGLLLIEIEASQGEAASELAHSALPNCKVSVLSDLAGHDRVVRVESPIHG